MMKVFYGDELSPLLSLVKAERETNQKVLVLLPSSISINNCQQALLRQVQTLEDVLFTTFEELALKVIEENSGYSFDLLDDQVERESVARALRDTGAFTSELRENPSFVSYVTNVLFELRRNAKSVSVDECLLPDELGNQKLFAELSDFEKQTLLSRGDVSRQLIGAQWKILKPAFKARYYTRELAIAEATRILSGPFGKEELADISQVFIAYLYHVDEVLLRFILSIASVKQTSFWVATDEKFDNITNRLAAETQLEKLTVRRPKPSKSIPIAAPDPRREIQFIARDVHRMVSHEESLPSEILVVARDSAQYEDVFYEVMREFGIAAEVQTRQYFRSLAVAHFYESLLNFATGNDREMAEALVEMLETGYPGVSEYSTYWMRAKIQRLGMSLSSLLSDLTGRPADDQIGGRKISWWLEQFNRLQGVKERLQRADSIERFLSILISSEPKMGIVELTSRRMQEQEAVTVPRGVRARELEGTLRLLKRLLRFHEAQGVAFETMGVPKIDLQRFKELFQDFLATESYGTTSQSREVLRMVDAGNIDFLHPKRLYLAGLSEGNFPSKIRETAFLGDRACKLVTDKRIAYLQNSDTTRGYEKWLFANCVDAAEESIAFSYSYLEVESHPRLYSPFLLAENLFQLDNLEKTIKDRIGVDSFVGSDVTADRDALRLAASTLGREATGHEEWSIKFQDSLLGEAFTRISSGSARLRKAPYAAELGSTRSNLADTTVEIDALNEFSACQFRYYSRYLLNLNPWNFKPYLRLRRFYFRVFQDLIPQFPRLNPYRLRKAVEEELEQRVRSDDFPHERLLRRLAAIVHGYFSYEVERCQNASSPISSRKMEFGRPITLSLDGLKFAPSLYVA